MVLSVNELSDGTAVTAVTDISNEFDKLRKAAHSLGLPNPDSINWTLVVSSTSDSASTQKRVNKLIQDCRNADEEKFGCATIMHECDRELYSYDLILDLLNGDLIVVN